MENKELDLTNNQQSEEIKTNLVEPTQDVEASQDAVIPIELENNSEEVPVDEKANTSEDVIPEKIDEVDSTTELSTEEESADSQSYFALPEFEEIVTKAEELAKSNDWQNGSQLFKELKSKWTELDVPEGGSESFKNLEVKFNLAEQTFFERRSQHYAEMDKKRKDNLEIKNGLLEKIEKLIERKKWAAQGELRAIQNRWEQVRHIPHDAVEELNKKYHSLLEVFETNRVEFLVKRKEQEELNLEGKFYTIDRLKMLINTIVPDKELDWTQLDYQFEEVQKDWKKIGRIPAEKTEELWNEFKSIKDLYYAKKLELNTSYKKEIESNERKKRALIARAIELKDIEDLAEAAREINRLHKEWKDIGIVSPEKSEELWNEFKAASDKFNSFKNDHLDEIKDQEKTNYDLKIKLCEDAEALSEEEDWKSASERFQKMLEDWKEIGPVPRRKTKKVWQRFKKAMDNFYARKRQHVKEIRSDEKDNLQKKRDLIELVKTLHEAENTQEAMAKVKEIQHEFNAIGFVPIKYKDKIYKQFKEVCDIVYKRSKSSSRSDSSFYEQSGNYADSETRRDFFGKSQKFNKLRKQAERLNETILNYSDTKTFIKPNKKGLALREEIELKIDALKSELAELNKEIAEMKTEMDSNKS